MTTAQVKKLLEARPFQPFTIHLANGSKLHLPHPKFMWIHPGGRTIHVAESDDENDGAAIIDLLLVTKLSTRVGNGTRRKK
jgi:hypothetical protein